MSISEPKAWKQQTKSTQVFDQFQQENVEYLNQERVPQSSNVHQRVSSNHQHIFSIEESLTQIIDFSEEKLNKLNTQDLDICKLLRYFWSDGSQALILRMNYFLSVNHKKISQNLKTLTQRLSKFKIKVQSLHKLILVFCNEDQSLRQQTLGKKQKQVQNELEYKKFINHQIIKIDSQTKCRLKLTNLQFFKEDSWNFSLSKAQIQSIKQRRRLCLKRFLTNTKLMEEREIQKESQGKQGGKIDIISPGKIETSLIISKRIQLQIMVKFSSIVQFLDIYEQSFKDSQFSYFFEFQPFNQIKNTSTCVIQVEIGKISDIILEIIKILNNNGSMRDYYSQHQESEVQGNDAIEVYLNESSNNTISFVPEKGKQQKPKQPEDMFIKSKKQEKHDYKVQKSNWGFPYRNNGIYELQYMLIHKKMNIELAKCHIFKLRSWMNQNFMEMVKDMVKNNQVYATLKKEITNFMRINQYKWFRAKQLYQKIYPQMPVLIKYFLSKTGFPTIQQQLDQSIKVNNMRQQIYYAKRYKMRQNQIQKLKLDLGINPQHFLDQIYYQYFKIKVNKEKQRRIIILVKTDEVISLQQLFNLFDTFSTDLSHELDVLNTLLYEYKINSPNLIEKQNRCYSDSWFSKYYLNTNASNIQCLGCSPYFFDKINIKDDKINKMPILAFQSIQYLKKQEINIKKEICSMMNQGGGIILFNCAKKSTQILPCGTRITQKDKEKYEQQIYSLLQCFYPKIEIGTDVLVNFVPVVKTPNERNYIHEDDFSQNVREYNKGCYVTRIRVCPTNATKIYFWYHEQKEKYYWSYKNHQRPKQLKYHSAYKLLKQKFNEFYIPDHYNARQRRMMQKQNNFFNHICKKPELGIPIADAYRQEGQRMIREPTSFVNFQRRYTYLSMLIAKKSDHQAIKRKFQSRGIKCEIEEKFKNYKFKNAKNTAVLYHNTRFENLLNIISFNPQFQFNTKMVLLIRVTEYIKIMNRNEKNQLPVDSYKHLCEWLKEEFPHEKLQVWELKLSNGTIKQFYISAGSKMSTVFMYFVLNNYSQKSIFKNPANLDQFTQQQKTLVWSQLTLEYDQKLKKESERLRQVDNMQNQRNNQSNQVNISHDLPLQYTLQKYYCLQKTHIDLQNGDFRRRFESLKNAFLDIQLQNDQISELNKGKLEIILTFSWQFQVQIILKFKKIEDLQNFYSRSKDKYFRKFFSFKLFNKVQQRSQPIQIKIDNIDHLSQLKSVYSNSDPQFKKIKPNQDQFMELNHQYHIQYPLYQITNKILIAQQGLHGCKQKKIINKDKAKQQQKPQQKQQFCNSVSKFFHNNQINLILAKSNIFQLKKLMNQNFLEIIKDMVKNYQIYTTFKKQIKQFMQINQYKLFRAKQLYEKLYPQMTSLISVFFIKTRIPTIQQQLNKYTNKLNVPESQASLENKKKVQMKFLQQLKKDLGILSEHFEDLIYYQYLRQKAKMNKSQKNGGETYDLINFEDYEIKIKILIAKSQQVSLPEFINKYALFFSTFSNSLSALQNLLSKYNILNNRNIIDSQGFFLDNISRMKNVVIDCLGCSTFFYQKWNIKDESINKSPVKSYYSIKYLNEYTKNLKRQICSMLNGGGGVILFDCLEKYGQMLPFGACIFQDDKQVYKKEIADLLNCFHPKVIIDQHIFVNFVPVADNPYPQNRKREGKLNQFNYRHGCYVTRIIVCPTDATQVYFWWHQDNQKYFWSYRPCRKIGNMRYHSAYKILKQKFKEFYILERYQSRQKQMMQKQNNFFNHRCKDPQQGIKLQPKIDQKPRISTQTSTEFQNKNYNNDYQ